MIPKRLGRLMLAVGALGFATTSVAVWAQAESPREVEVRVGLEAPPDELIASLDTGLRAWNVRVTEQWVESSCAPIVARTDVRASVSLNWAAGGPMSICFSTQTRSFRRELGPFDSLHARAREELVTIIEAGLEALMEPDSESLKAEGGWSVAVTQGDWGDAARHFPRVPPPRILWPRSESATGRPAAWTLGLGYAPMLWDHDVVAHGVSGFVTRSVDPHQRLQLGLRVVYAPLVRVDRNGTLLWGCGAASDQSLFSVGSAPMSNAVTSAQALATAPTELFQRGQVADGCDPALQGLVGNTPLRRLTRDEYANTIRDLLGIDWRPPAYFPVDTRVGGYDAQGGGFPANDVGEISQSQVMIYAETAEKIATAAVESPWTLAPWLRCAEGQTDRECAQTFIESFGARAFRRKLDEDQVDRLLALHAAGAAGGGFTAGIRAVISGLLQSPYFLYHAEYKNVHHFGASLPLEPYEMAARVSYFLWDSLPDIELWRAASAGELASDDGLRAQAERMIADARFATALHSFTESWLGIGGVAHLGAQLDGQTFGEAAWRETVRFVEYVVRQADDHGLQTLLTAGFSFPEAALNGVYGIDAPDGYDGSTPLLLPPGERAGVLTQASTLFAMRPHLDSSAPTSRGLYVLRNFLCTNVDYLSDQHYRHSLGVQPGQTDRERLEQETQVEGCNGCHDKISPIGFAFERYDGLGVWRDVDSLGNPINDKGGLAIGDSRDGDAQGALQLGEVIATSDAARTCMVLQMQRFALARAETVNDTCSLVSLAQSFSASGFDVRQLMLDLVMQPTFRSRPGS